MRVLVTGAAGFIGSHVAEALTADGHEVRWLDSLSPVVHNGKPPYIPNAAEFFATDVRDSAGMDKALDGIDAVCHLAAMVGLGVSLADLPAYADVNVTGTAVLLDAMGRRGVSRLVLSSSMVVYGEGAYSCPSHAAVRPLPRAAADLEAGIFEPRCPSCGAVLSTSRVREDAPLDPRNAYATSKVAQEHLAANWARLTGGSAVALRYHNVYGPRMPRDTPYSGVAAIFRSSLENGAPPRVFEDGRQLRDFVHVRDVADCNVLALAALAGDGARVGDGARAGDGAGAVSPAAGTGSAGQCRAYNVASGTPRTVGDMATVLAAAFAGSAGSLEPKITGEYRLGDVRHIAASPEAAARDLGFRARTSFTEGVAEFARAPLRAPGQPAL
jgi:dTDP-L-rhamnose 4-epimerase